MSRRWTGLLGELKRAFRNLKFLVGFALLILFVIIAAFGPLAAKYGPLEYTGVRSAPPDQHPPLGTNRFGYDVYSQLVYGLQSSLLVGLIGGSLATVLGLLIGFASGYLGGKVDEFLMAVTNVLLVLPTMALLIIIAAYLPYRGITIESLIIGFTSWPWTARAVRAQTLSLKTREFVLTAKMSGEGSLGIVFNEIAPNMASYIFMVFILQFGGAILYAVGLDFLGLGPTAGISLGLMLQQATLWNAVQLGQWWWAIPPGLIIALLLVSLFLINTGLDEVFNPRLRR
ncbi:ABC transporter permease [Infirmifilum sp. NZ]|uniref:ABC transporter permease n=1 Tax=Infirmifilum sp. NZ TaxID=2926850 RepID=UPI0027A66236|nr:ABC transporter permease [Infirmifilum sp. NZ]UNQ73331.1 ABC transporter permease [Infirmifilum sp. NZ]